MKIKAIKTKKDYGEVLAGIERLMDARPNTRDGDRLEVLVALVQAYEARHFTLPIERSATFLKRRAGKAKPSDLMRFLGGAHAAAHHDSKVVKRVKKAAATRRRGQCIPQRGQRRIAALIGKFDWDPSYDYKNERARR